MMLLVLGVGILIGWISALGALAGSAYLMFRLIDQEEDRNRRTLAEHRGEN